MQLIFNRDAQLKYGFFKKELQLIEKYKDFLKVETSEKEQTNNNSNKTLSKELLEYGEKTQDKIAEIQSNIKDKIIKLFYSLNDTDLDDLSIDQYNRCVEEINTYKPEVFKLFFIAVK